MANFFDPNGGDMWGGALGGLFDPGGGLKVAADPYGDARTKLLKYLTGDPANPNDTGLIGKAGPTYSGETVAPLSTQQNQSFDFLNKYGASDFGSTMGAAKNEINKTLGDAYDPTTSPYYQAVKATAAQNLKNTNTQIASDSAGAGRYFTGARLKAQAKAATDSGNSLDTIMGTLAQQERQNKLSVIPQAMSLAQSEQQLPLQKATAFQTLGALPQQNAQAQDTSNLSQWQNSNLTYPMQILNMIAGIQTPPTYQQTPPGIGTQLLTGAGSSMASMLPLMMMGLI